jgi:hypothetical protein
MYRQRNRFLFTLLCTILLCSIVQATILQISVQDSIDNSTIPRATVFLNGENYARTNNNGQVFLNHSGLDDPLIRVSVTGYDDWEKLVAKNATSLLVNLSRKSITLKVNIYDSDTLGSISGALVNISSDYITQTKLTDISGSVSFDVNATIIYSLEIIAPNYLSRSATVDMGTEDKDTQYLMLQANQFSFVIQDKSGMAAVPDAEVYIDNALVGKTNTRGVLTLPIIRGKVYTLEIKKNGYLTYTESREISQTDALYSVTLSKAVVGVFISVFNENRAPILGADVYMNGTFSGTTNQYGRLNIPNLISGAYRVEVRKAGYVAGNRTILVTNPNEDYTFELLFESVDLTLFVQEKDQKMVPNATILLNGNIVGFTDDHGQYRTQVKFNTPFNITAIKDTYQPAMVQKQFDQGNASASVTLIVEKSLDWGLISIIVIGAISVLILFAVIRILGGRKRKHVVRRNEI